MSENSWVLKGVDAETRQQAVAEARRRGVSLADYLTNVVLQCALTEQLPGSWIERDDAGDARQVPVPAPPQENFVARHRLEALERRVGLAVGSLESAVQALDGSVFGLAARVDEAEALATDAADQFGQTMQDTGANLASLRKRLADVEEQADAQTNAHDGLSAAVAERCAGLEQHICAVEDAARAANTSAAQLAMAHEALKYAVADDFSAFASKSAARLSTGLDEVRRAAYAAAEQADAAVAHLIAELRATRESIEARLLDGAAETHKNMRSAFADAAERMNALSERVTTCERLTSGSAEQLRTQIADVEDGAQTALEETAMALRQAGAALAAEFVRATQDNRTALESVHGDLSSEIAELRDRQAAGLTRLKLVDTAAANTIGEVAALRESLDLRSTQAAGALRAALAQAQTDWNARFDAFAARLANSERAASEVHRALHAGAERVETCTFAALEKLARDRLDGDAALGRRLDQALERLDGDLGEMRDRSSGALAQLKLLEQMLGAQDLSAASEAATAPLRERVTKIESALETRHGVMTDRVNRLESEIAGRAIDRGFDERLLRLEAAAESEETAHALAALRGQIGALAAKADAQQADESMLQRLDELRTRVFAYESQAGEAADRVDGLARTLGRITAHRTDVASQTDERLQKMELAIAGMQANDDDARHDLNSAVIHAMQQRVAELEERQADALEGLSADIARFMSENERRLETLENNLLSAAAYDVASEFEALRQRVEERVLGVEQRSVRALEQVADTMATLEKRFHAGPEADARSA